VQPDRGRLCTFWLAALIAVLRNREGTNQPALDFALERLAAFVFCPTGHAVPEPLRAPLLDALAHVHGELDALSHALVGARGDAESTLSSSARVGNFCALQRVLQSDAVFEPLTAGHAISRPFAANPQPRAMDILVHRQLCAVFIERKHQVTIRCQPAGIPRTCCTPAR
jgi:hypothetical protein